jgi:hypothetical protein
MERNDADIHRRLTHRHGPGAMDHTDAQTRMTLRDGFQQAADFAQSHFGVGFVFERGEGMAALFAADDATKFDESPMSASRGQWGISFREGRAGELNLNLHMSNESASGYRRQKRDFVAVGEQCVRRGVFTIARQTDGGTVGGQAGKPLQQRGPESIPVKRR